MVIRESLASFVYFFYEGVIKSGKWAGGKGMAQGLKGHDHVHLAVKELPCGKIHVCDLFMLTGGSFDSLGRFGISAALISADRFLDVDR